MFRIISQEVRDKIALHINLTLDEDSPDDQFVRYVNSFFSSVTHEAHSSRVTIEYISKLRKIGQQAGSLVYQSLRFASPEQQSKLKGLGVIEITSGAEARPKLKDTIYVGDSSTITDIEFVPNDVPLFQGQYFKRLCVILSEIKYIIPGIEDMTNIPKWIYPLQCSLPDVTFACAGTPGYFKPYATYMQGKANSNGEFIFYDKKDAKRFSPPSYKGATLGVFEIIWAFDPKLQRVSERYEAIASIKTPVGTYNWMSQTVAGIRDPALMRTFLPAVHKLNGRDADDVIGHQACYLNIKWIRTLTSWETTAFTRELNDNEKALQTITAQKGAGKGTLAKILTSSLPECAIIDSDTWGRKLAVASAIIEIIKIKGSCSDTDTLAIFPNVRYEQISNPKDIYKHLARSDCSDVPSAFKSEVIKHLTSPVKFATNGMPVSFKSLMKKYYLRVLTDDNLGYRNYVLSEIDNLRSIGYKTIFVECHTTPEQSLLVGETAHWTMQPNVPTNQALLNRRPQDVLSTAEIDGQGEILLRDFYRQFISQTKSDSALRILVANGLEPPVIAKVHINRNSDNRFETFSQFLKISPPRDSNNKAIAAAYKRILNTTPSQQFVPKILRLRVNESITSLQSKMLSYSTYLDFADYYTTVNVAPFMQLATSCGVAVHVNQDLNLMYASLSESAIYAYITFQLAYHNVETRFKQLPTRKDQLTYVVNNHATLFPDIPGKAILMKMLVGDE